MRSAQLLIVSIAVCTLCMRAQHGAAGPVSPWREMMSSMHTMHAAMVSAEASGDGDVDFVQLMLPHHQAAIEMAKTQLVYGRDPEMRRLAQEIIADQQSEIALMQLWLKQHGTRK
jgi:uncharacterized protein (DUF305 family)